MGPDSVPVARAIVESSQECPTLVADGQELPVTVHAEPAPEKGFPNRVCTGNLPVSYAAAQFGQTKLPALRADKLKYAIVGDTGNRVKVHNNGSLPCSEGGVTYDTLPDGVCFDSELFDANIQGISPSLDPASNPWPWSTIADEMAAHNPDVVIHVGDYVYREMACPAVCPDEAGNPSVCDCFGEQTSGDMFSDWKSELFDPAARLLAAAPWIVLRGNHETCSRSGAGWFRYLDPRPVPADGCTEFTDPYQVTLGDDQWIVIDSNDLHPVGDGIDHYGGDCPASQELILGLDPSEDEEGEYATEFPAFTDIFTKAKALQDPSKSQALLTHRPLYAITCNEGTFINLDFTLQKAATEAGFFDGNVKFVLAGHYHLFQYLEFDENLVSSLVFGHGGTKLFNSDVDISLVYGATVQTEEGSPAGKILPTSRTYREFGYGIMEISPEEYSIVEGSSQDPSRYAFSIKK